MPGAFFFPNHGWRHFIGYWGVMEEGRNEGAPKSQVLLTESYAELHRTLKPNSLPLRISACFPRLEPSGAACSIRNRIVVGS